jgi:hypothetical protein
MINQLKKLEEAMQRKIDEEAKRQDELLKEKLAKRRQRRNKLAEKEREVKIDNVDARIKFEQDQLDKDRKLKYEANRLNVEQIINEMKMKMTREELPAAISKVVDTTHEAELHDLLVKLYEQKSVELKEKLMALLEEKLTKQNVIHSTFDDRIKALKDLLMKMGESEENEDAKARLDAKLQDLVDERDAELEKLEPDFHLKE